MQEYFESILVPIDFGPNTPLVIKQSYVLAQLMNVDIVLQYAINNKENEDIDYSEVERNLEELAEKAKQKYNLNFFPVISKGNITDCIVDFSKENYCKMIIMGNIGKSGINKEDIFRIGKTTSRVVQKSQCPVLTINSEIIYDLTKILLPLDLSKQTEEKAKWAIQFSRLFGCMVKVIAVTNNKKDIKILNEKILNVKNELNENNVFCSTEIIELGGNNYDMGELIVDYARKNECDLIMIMTRQEDSKSSSHVGRTASSIISMSLKPILSITPNIKYETIK